MKTLWIKNSFCNHLYINEPGRTIIIRGTITCNSASITAESLIVLGEITSRGFISLHLKNDLVNLGGITSRATTAFPKDSLESQETINLLAHARITVHRTSQRTTLIMPPRSIQDITLTLNKSTLALENGTGCGTLIPRSAFPLI